MTTQNRHQKLRLHNDYEPTKDDQSEQRQQPNLCSKPIYGISTFS